MNRQKGLGLIFGVALSVIVIGFGAKFLTSKVEKDVKSGKAILYCQFKDGYRAVDPKKVVSFDDESGCWAFTNGWACNCDVEDLNKKKSYKFG